MKIIISPAKRMIAKEDIPYETSAPLFQAESEKLRAYLKKQSYDSLKSILKTSDSLTQTIYSIYQTPRFNKTPALFTYSGLAFRTMAPDVFNDQEMKYINEHLRILSALYGVLRPMDGIEPYRLEMAAKCPFSLYAFWKDKIAWALNDEIIVNLASEEYAKCLRPYKKMIEFKFLDIDDREKGVYAKKARGEMVRYMAENQIEDLNELKKFDRLGYRFIPEKSTDDFFVFKKQKAN